MQTKNNELLQKEIERQNKIIDVLLNRNKELEEMCNACENWWQDAINLTRTNPHFAEALSSMLPASVDFILHNGKSFLPAIRKLYGTPETFCPSNISMDGKNEMFRPSNISLVGKDEKKEPSTNLMVGKNETFCHSNISMVGNNKNNMPSAQLMVGKNKTHNAIGKQAGNEIINGHHYNKTTAGNVNVPPMTCKTITTDRETELLHKEGINIAALTNNTNAGNTGKTIFIWKLETLIGRVIVRSNQQGLVSAADILMRLEHSSKQSMKQLQSLTGLSQSGMGKRIMSLKRYGLIKRGPNRHLLLTDKARELLDKARR